VSPEFRSEGRQPFRPATAAAMFFLNATQPETIKVMRTAMVDVGFKAQRAANNFLRGLANKQTAAPPSTVGRAPLKEQVIHFVNKKMPGGLPNKTARALLDIEDKEYVPIIRNPKTTNADTEAVFYFPGCGSERLFSQVGLATQAMLWHAGVQTVLPPGYLCCGYPQRGSGDYDKAEKIITDNRVLFHRVANTLNYLDIRTVVVSCGTCMDQLEKYQFEKIFPWQKVLEYSNDPQYDWVEPDGKAHLQAVEVNFDVLAGEPGPLLPAFGQRRVVVAELAEVDFKGNQEGEQDCLRVVLPAGDIT
jgi:hypothetical protein